MRLTYVRFPNKSWCQHFEASRGWTSWRTDYRTRDFTSSRPHWCICDA